MKAQYICNCVSYQGIFDNASDMAYAVENAKRISRKDFYNKVEIIPLHKRIKRAEYNQVKNLLILYDITKDIHYFYL